MGGDGRGWEGKREENLSILAASILSEREREREERRERGERRGKIKLLCQLVVAELSILAASLAKFS